MRTNVPENKRAWRAPSNLVSRVSMVTPSDLLHISCTPGLIEGGIAYALHALPQIQGPASGERVQRAAAAAAAELALRRLLSEQQIPFDVEAGLPFTGPMHYAVTLGGRRCALQTCLIRHREQVEEIRRDPSLLLRAPALVASDRHAAEGQSRRDLYLFAFLTGHVTASGAALAHIPASGESHYFAHFLPGSWSRPAGWNSLGTLVLKSEAEQTLTVEIGGQDERRRMQVCTVELPPRTRVELEDSFFTLSYLHARSPVCGRIGMYSPVRRETYLAGSQDWVNLWIYNADIWLAGYMSREEFSQRARFIPAGSRIFQYERTQLKNLAVPVAELRPLAGLLARAGSAPADAVLKSPGP